MNDQQLLPGVSLRPLPGEQVKKQYSGLVLTERRLIFSARNFVQAAFLKDVDYAGVITRGLPLWILILGIVLSVSGFGLLQTNSNDFNSNNNNDTFGFLILLLGIGLVLAWLFVKNTYLVFSVSGADKFGVKATSVGGTSPEAIQFMSDVFDIKARLPIE